MAETTSTTDQHVPAATTGAETEPSPRWPTSHPVEIQRLQSCYQCHERITDDNWAWHLRGLTYVRFCAACNAIEEARP